MSLRMRKLISVAKERWNLIQGDQTSRSREIARLQEIKQLGLMKSWATGM